MSSRVPLWPGLARRRSSYRAETTRLLRCVSTLPDGTWRAVTLHKVCALSVPDIAARLGLTAREIEQQLVSAALAFSRSIDFSNCDERAPQSNRHENTQHRPRRSPTHATTRR